MEFPFCRLLLRLAQGTLSGPGGGFTMRSLLSSGGRAHCKGTILEVRWVGLGKVVTASTPHRLGAGGSCNAGGAQHRRPPLTPSLESTDSECGPAHLCERVCSEQTEQVRDFTVARTGNRHAREDYLDKSPSKAVFDPATCPKMETDR